MVIEKIPLCECELCEKYRPLYDQIKLEGMWWLTISPRPSEKEPDVDLEEWLNEFTKMSSAIKSILGVVELTNMRFHLHIVFSQKDKIKCYKKINGFKLHNMVRIYKGEPEKGLHYMFKEYEETKEYLVRNDPIFDTDVLNNIKQIKKSVRELHQMQTRKSVLDEPEIPKCFRASDCDTCSIEEKKKRK